MALSFILTLMTGQAYADPVWIDVRTLSESLRDNIEGDIRISHSNIVSLLDEKGVIVNQITALNIETNEMAKKLNGLLK